jgi:hypothetical protein
MMLKRNSSFKSLQSRQYCVSSCQDTFSSISASHVDSDDEEFLDIPSLSANHGRAFSFGAQSVGNRVPTYKESMN